MKKKGIVDNAGRPPFQSKQEVIIDASLKSVWEFSQDLAKIADYHPRVNKVDLISGKRQREAGVAYLCHLNMSTLEQRNILLTLVLW